MYTQIYWTEPFFIFKFFSQQMVVIFAGSQGVGCGGQKLRRPRWFCSHDSNKKSLQTAALLTQNHCPQTLIFLSGKLLRIPKELFSKSSFGGVRGSAPCTRPLAHPGAPVPLARSRFTGSSDTCRSRRQACRRAPKARSEPAACRNVPPA